MRFYSVQSKRPETLGGKQMRIERVVPVVVAMAFGLDPYWRPRLRDMRCLQRHTSDKTTVLATVITYLSVHGCLQVILYVDNEYVLMARRSLYLYLALARVRWYSYHFSADCWRWMCCVFLQTVWLSSMPYLIRSLLFAAWADNKGGDFVLVFVVCLRNVVHYGSQRFFKKTSWYLYILFWNISRVGYIWLDDRH